MCIQSSTPPPPPLHNEGGEGGGLKIFARKGGKAKWWVYLKMGGCHIILRGFSGDSLWCCIGNLGVFIFLLLTNMC